MNFNSAAAIAAAAAVNIIPLPTSIVRLGSGSGSKNMEWTNDDALELIEQYRCHTELWNRADPKYKDKLCRFRAWSEIAERFGCSKAEVERKMNVLLTQYRREKHKMFVKIYQGIQPNPSKWYAFKRFDFMEAGGGSLSGGSGASGSSTGSTSGGGGGGGIGVAAVTGTNGLNGLAAAAAAVAKYEPGSAAALASPSGSSTSGPHPSVGVHPSHHHHQQQHHHHHRRIKTKELKYFGAMGLNIPMLIANSPTLDHWNTVGPYSPPIGSERSQLRVPLPMSFSAGTPSNAERAIFSSSGGGGGGSSSSEFNPSPQKPMDTSDIEDNKDEVITKHERHTPLPTHTSGSGGDGGGVLGGGGSLHETSNTSEQLHDAGEIPVAGIPTGIGIALQQQQQQQHETQNETGDDAGSSPIPNTNIHEAHKNHQHQQQQQQQHHLPTNATSLITTAAVAAAAQQQHQQQQQQQRPQSAATPRLAHRHQTELDIKQELVDYFHAPPPPAPPDSHRSYSSTEELRPHELDYAQDLRVAAAKSGLDFSQFVLPSRNSQQRRSMSGDSYEEKYTPPAMPLNMRKLSAAAAAASGHMLMNSLLSHESMSDDPDMDADATRSAASPAHLKSNSSTHDASSAAAAAAALYAESLNKDDCDFIGSNVSLKLRAMDRTQRIIAEKLISEVLYYGQFNELERTARIQPSAIQPK